jgi:hypothetical protein
VHCQWGVKLYSHHRKQFHNKLHIELACEPVTLPKIMEGRDSNIYLHINVLSNIIHNNHKVEIITTNVHKEINRYTKTGT